MPHIESVRSATSEEEARIMWRPPTKEASSYWKDYLEVWQQILVILETHKTAVVEIESTHSSRLPLDQQYALVSTPIRTLSLITGIKIQTKIEIDENDWKKSRLFIRFRPEELAK